LLTANPNAGDSEQALQMPTRIQTQTLISFAHQSAAFLEDGWFHLITLSHGAQKRHKVK